MEREGLPSPQFKLSAGEVRLEVGGDPEARFVYRLNVEPRPLPAFSNLEAPEGRRSQEWRLIARTEPRGRRRDLTGLDRDQLVNDVLEQLAEWRRWVAAVAPEALPGRAGA